MFVRSQLSGSAEGVNLLKSCIAKVFFIALITSNFACANDLEKNTQVINSGNVGNEQILFNKESKHLPLVNSNLRKWDVGTVVDLDQDGFPDLLLNDHGFSLKVLWNNNGRFAKPYDLIMGDMHGVSAGDFDKDGNVEIAVSRGGGVREVMPETPSFFGLQIIARLLMCLNSNSLCRLCVDER